MTESEVIKIIDNIANRLAARFKFGYHGVDDMKQQARLYAWQGLVNYDNIRPLENFLWVHTKNRLCNYKRNKYERSHLPCINCKVDYDELEEACDEYVDISECPVYLKWVSRNLTKKNLMSPIELSNVCDHNEDNMYYDNKLIDIISNNELKKIIDMKLPIEFRADYLRLISDVYVPKIRYLKVQNIIQEILEEYQDGI